MLMCLKEFERIIYLSPSIKVKDMMDHGGKLVEREPLA